MFYVILILFSMAWIVASNLLLFPSEQGQWLCLAASTVLGTISVILWDAVQAFFIRHLPAAWFKASSPIFAVGEKERLRYRRWRVNEWKTLIPELGVFTRFSKSEFARPDDPEYLARFLLESNYGVVIHLSNALLGIAIVFLPWCSALRVALPIAAVNLLLNLLPAVILRFNTAPLRRIYKRQKAKAR